MGKGSHPKRTRNVQSARKVLNTKASRKSVTNEVRPLEIQREASVMLQNGLSTALLGFNPGQQGSELSQVDTLFKNNRWYLISNMRQLLSEVYVEHGIIQTVVDVPVDDGMRGGVVIHSKELSEDEIKELEIAMEREDILDSVIGRALKWNRLYGGAGVIILTDQDPSTPLDMTLLTEDSPLEFRAVDMWELFWDKQNTEGFNMDIQKPEFEFYNYYALKVHKSRVMKMKGLEAPSFIRPRLRGWGFSIVETLVRSINQYLKATDLCFEVLDEFKVDVFKLKNLSNTLLSPNGSAKIQERVRITNQQKSYQNAMTLDSEDDYIQKELSFAGLAETMEGIRMQVASDMRMPLSKIFGISAAKGFQNGEDDIENYNAMVESQVRSKSKYHIIKIIELMCQQKFGMVPDDLSIDFKPLRMLSAVDEETVKTAKFTRLLQAKQANEITSLEFRDGINKDNLLDITLATDEASLPDPDDALEDPDKEDDDGANKTATEDASPLSKKDPKTGKKEKL